MTPKRSPASAKFPFLFFGSRPEEFHLDQRGAGYSYEVCFAREPDGATLAKIGEVVRAAASEKVGFGVAPWLWSGRWALTRVCTKRRSGFFADAIALFKSVHAVAPIACVVFWDASSFGAGPWEKWTRAQLAAPPSGPPLPHAFQGRVVDATLAPAVVRADFEAARLGLKFDVAPCGVTIVAQPIGAGSPEDADEELPREVAKHFTYSDILFRGPGTRLVASLRETTPETYACVDSKGTFHRLPDLREREHPHSGFITSAAFDPEGGDGAYVAMASHAGASLFALDLRTGKLEQLWRSTLPDTSPPPRLLPTEGERRATPAYLGPRVAVATGTHVRLFDRDGSKLRPTRELALPDVIHLSSMGENVLLAGCVREGGTSHVAVVVDTGEDLVAAALLPGACMARPAQSDGAVAWFSHRSYDSFHARLVNVMAAVDAARRRPS